MKIILDTVVMVWIKIDMSNADEIKTVIHKKNPVTRFDQSSKIKGKKLQNFESFWIGNCSPFDFNPGSTLQSFLDNN